MLRVWPLLGLRRVAAAWRPVVPMAPVCARACTPVRGSCSSSSSAASSTIAARASISSARLRRCQALVNPSRPPVTAPLARSYATPTPENLSVETFEPEHIRNFCIVAHIDHGKTTLSNRILELTGVIVRDADAKDELVLDNLQVEKERGITVKAQTCTMVFQHAGRPHLLNLIDTPGHVDFSYEVSRSLAACEGAVLLVDAAQGIQAQTVANWLLAIDGGLEIVYAVNKIDMPNANAPAVIADLHRTFGVDPDHVVKVSAKTGVGVADLLAAVIQHIPPPKADKNKALRALLFDSWYDVYRGVVCLMRLENGSLKKGDRVKFCATEQSYDISDVGLLRPKPVSCAQLFAGQVGYIATGMRTTKEARVGDTVVSEANPAPPYPGFKPAVPMVFAGIYPADGDDFNTLRDAVEKLLLTDASVTMQRESSVALGFGFRCGFLGLLHMEVFLQRLDQEFNVGVIATAPSVLYKIRLTDKTEIHVDSPDKFPPTDRITESFEPMVKASIVTPPEYLGDIIKLLHERRAHQQGLEYLTDTRILLKYRIPLGEVILDFFDSLKCCSSGYASFDYEEDGYASAELVKVSILLNAEPVEELSAVVPRVCAEQYGRGLAQRLKAVIPRQLYQVAIQAAIGSKIIARETITAYRKDVLAKCYGGDVTRKRKLLEKQKEGKKRMRSVGRIEVPQEAFFTVLKRS